MSLFLKTACSSESGLESLVNKFHLVSPKRRLKLHCGCTWRWTSVGQHSVIELPGACLDHQSGHESRIDFCILPCPLMALSGHVESLGDTPTIQPKADIHCAM